MTIATSPDAAYFLDHYGTCAVTPCLCNGTERPWSGRGCPNWRPSGALSFDDLMARARRRREERRACA